MDVKILVTQQPFWKSRVVLTDIWTLPVMNKSKLHYNRWYTEKNIVFLCIRGLFNDAVRSSKYRHEWQNKWIGKKITFFIPCIIIHLLQFKPKNEHKIFINITIIL